MTNFERVQVFGSSLVLKGDEISGAQFSHCDRYRYSLWRTWTEKGLDGRLCAFIGLNPSTATHEQDDPTIRRCIRFCKDWGFDGYVMLNLFAFRATDPADMKFHNQRLYMEEVRNTKVIDQITDIVDMIVCAWGAHGTFLNQGEAIRDYLKEKPLHHLGLTKGGYPGHPLYKRASTKPIRWK